jgi:hypothetical protein
LARIESGSTRPSRGLSASAPERLGELAADGTLIEVVCDDDKEEGEPNSH